MKKNHQKTSHRFSFFSQQSNTLINSNQNNLMLTEIWRGIALGNIIAKILSPIIATRLTQHINTFGIDEQCGCLYVQMQRSH